MKIADWLTQATQQLANASIDSARLDAELLLAETLRQPRTYLHAHPDQGIDRRRQDIAEARLSLRLDRVPLAYILGHKEFYGRTFRVTPAVLIPRPESEQIIELLLSLIPPTAPAQTLLDVGTGSGCLGITAALERPQLRVRLSDVSRPALQVASANAKRLRATVTVQRQSLLAGQVEPLDCILANLPYVATDWPTSPELQHEPAQALYAPDEGLRLIRRLLAQAPQHLNQYGLMILEADPRQQSRLIAEGQRHGFRPVDTTPFATALQLMQPPA